MKGNIIKVLGLAATVVGVGVSILSDWVDEKKMDDKIEKGINKAFTERESEEA